jgi:hypothetical protein
MEQLHHLALHKIVKLHQKIRLGGVMMLVESAQRWRQYLK